MLLGLESRLSCSLAVRPGIKTASLPVSGPLTSGHRRKTRSHDESLISRRAMFGRWEWAFTDQGFQDVWKVTGEACSLGGEAFSDQLGYLVGENTSLCAGGVKPSGDLQFASPCLLFYPMLSWLAVPTVALTMLSRYSPCACRTGP